MKRNIYSYSKLWMIFFVLMGAACTNQVEDAIPVSGQPIEFSVQSDWKEIHNSRSNDKTQFVKDDVIQIFGFHTSFPNGVEKVQKFMYREGEPNKGQIVKFDGTNWIYSPKRFWPKEGKLDFFASYPYNSIRNDKVNEPMIYEQPSSNTLRCDLLWGVSGKDCASALDRKNNVEITMKHALAKVNIILDGSLGDIGQVTVSAYKAGRFTQTDDSGIPDWKLNDDDKMPIYTNFYKFGDEKDKDLNEKNTVTVFILPEKITGLWLFDYHGDKIYDPYVSDEIQKHKFEAGKVYNLTISKSKGVRKKNTNSRSIAMSVRCVSE